MSKSSYLLVEDTIPYSPHLALLLGVCAALILQQTYYWCMKNREKKINLRDGHYWTYGTYKDWEGWLCGFDERTIRRNIVSLAEKKLLVIGRYNHKAFDKTNWYRVDANEVRSLLLSNPLPSGHGVHTVCPICPDDAANLSMPIPETTEETKKEKSFASPEQKPLKPNSTSEDEMLPKNQSKKGPTSASSVVAEVLAPPSVKKETLILALYKVWAIHVPRNHDEVKFVGEFNMKQKGLIGQCGRFWKSRAEGVLLFVIENWTKFGKYVNSQAGTKSFPAIPQLEFLVKHKELAINFYLNKAEAKDASVQLTATVVKPSSSLVVKKIGKIVLKKGGSSDVCTDLSTTLPAQPMASAAPVVEEDDDDAPVTLEFLLQQKFGKV